jgi:hypothetical protein
MIKKMFLAAIAASTVAIGSMMTASTASAYHRSYGHYGYYGGSPNFVIVLGGKRHKGYRHCHGRGYNKYCHRHRGSGRRHFH